MKIIDVTKKNKFNITVLFENGEKLYLAYEIFVKNGIKKNMDISANRLSSLVKENQIYNIKQRTGRLLARRSYSVNELRIKLKQKGYDSILTDNVLNDLIQKGYLDDIKFAEIFAEENIKRKLWSTQKIKAELMKKGVDKTVINEVLSNKLLGFNDIENAAVLTEKKFNILKLHNYEQKKLKLKLFNYLSGKGYNYSVSNEAIDKVLGNMNESQ